VPQTTYGRFMLKRMKCRDNIVTYLLAGYMEALTSYEG